MIWFLFWAAIGGLMSFVIALLSTKKLCFASPIAMTIIVFIVAFLFRPPFSLFMPETWIMLVLIAFGSSGLVKLANDDTFDEGLGLIGPGIAVVLAVFAVLFSFFSSTAINRGDRYASVISVEEMSRDAELSVIDQVQAPRVTPTLAQKEAASLIASSQEVGLGSRMTIGDMWGNVVKGSQGPKAVWAAPMEHANFWRKIWREPLPGFFTVSYANENDSQMYEDRPIIIGEKAMFDHNVYRRLYLAGYVSYRFGDAFFQLDDENNPYFLVPLMRPSIGFNAYWPVKWVLVNAADGELTEYTSVDDLPAWIDRAYPAETVFDRLNDWGCYKEGTTTCWFGKSGIIEPTRGIKTTLAADGETMIYYTGTQFATTQNQRASTDGSASGSLGATSGLATIDTRTGAAKFYVRSGITEIAAREAMLGAMSNYKGRYPSDPIMVQVNGKPTYYSLMLDQSGNRKGYAFASVENRNVVAIGESMAEALRELGRSWRANREDVVIDPESSDDLLNFEGVIVKITPVVQDGETTFYVQIDTVPNKVFAVMQPRILEVAMSELGDQVRIVADSDSPALIEALLFDNHRLEFTESSAQQAFDKAAADAEE